MAKNDLIVDLGMGEYAVSIETANPWEVTEWIRENCLKENVEAVTAYVARDNVYKLTAKFRDLVPATHFKLYWYGQK